jgi:hypothetical protein
MRGLILTLCILAAACDKAPVASAPETDPAITDALADPIMADPGLALAQGRTGQIGVPVGIAPELPPGLPTLGTLWKTNDLAAGCARNLFYNYTWSFKLPADLMLPDNAKVIEAAGNDAIGCALRIVRYGTTGSPAESLNVWQNRSGVRAKHVGIGVDGTSGPTVFRVIAYLAPKGATVDLIIVTK